MHNLKENASSRHQIKVRTEKFSMSEVNQAIDRVRKNQARYRVVLEN
jgi:D-arabinose 1-dehydrogenase-like Zn-dependent alcohol dehydrogenase